MKEKMKLRIESNNTENRKNVKKINATESGSQANVNKIATALVKSTKRKRENT